MRGRLNGIGQTVRSQLDLRLAPMSPDALGKDEAGNEGRSAPFEHSLPERLFTKPLACALVEQRLIRASMPNHTSQVYSALDALNDRHRFVHPEAGPLSRHCFASALFGVGGRPHRRCDVSRWSAIMWALRGHHRLLHHHRCRTKPLSRQPRRRFKQSLERRRQRLRDQEAHRESGARAGQFQAPACRTVAQKSQQAGPVRSSAIRE